MDTISHFVGTPWLNSGDFGIVWSAKNRVVEAEIWAIVSDAMSVGGSLVGNAKHVLAMILIDLNHEVQSVFVNTYNRRLTVSRSLSFLV